jgi:hypothetical protein
MSDIYKIGVEIALTGSILQGLEAISSRLLGLNLQAKNVEGGFKRMAVAIGGVASIFGGVAVFKGMEKVVSAGGELVKQQALLRNLGVSQADVMETTAKAQLATHKIIGTTIAENVKGMREMMGVMPNLKEAQDKYVSTMQAAKVLESLTGTPADQSLQTLAKAIELRGGGVDPKTHQLDPERFQREAIAATKAIIASGGLVNAQQLLAMMKTAGPMARMIDNPDVFYKGIITAMMDMGGFRAGTAMTALGRQLLGGKMTKPTAEEMERFGVLKHGGWHSSGVGVYVDPGALKGEDILKDSNRGVAAWMNLVLIPAFNQMGLKSNADVQQELYRFFGTETARRTAGLFVQNQGQIARDAKLYDQALGGQAYGNVAAGDLGANVTNLQTAFTNLMQAFGAPMVPVAIQAMQSLANAMNNMAGFALAHPGAMKMIGEGLVGLSAGLVALGVGAVIAAAVALAPGGMIAAAIVGIGAAVAALAAMNWSGVSKGLQDFRDSADKWHASVHDAIASLASRFVTEVSALPGIVGGAIKAAFAAIGSEIISAVSAIPGEIAKSVGGFFNNQAPVGRHNPLLNKNSFVTPRGRAAVHVTTALNLDGRELARAVSYHVAALYEHPLKAPYFDDHEGYAGPDMQTVTT